ERPLAARSTRRGERGAVMLALSPLSYGAAMRNIMATKRPNWLKWLAALIAAAGIAAGSWYAYSHGWLTHAYAWVRHSASKDQAAKSDEEEMVDMPGMPGMKMPKDQKKTEATSGVPGH